MAGDQLRHQGAQGGAAGPLPADRLRADHHRRGPQRRHRRGDRQDPPPGQGRLSRVSPPPSPSRRTPGAPRGLPAGPVTAALGVALLAALTAAVSRGSTSIPPAEVWSVVGRRLVRRGTQARHRRPDRLATPRPARPRPRPSSAPDSASSARRRRPWRAIRWPTRACCGRPPTAPRLGAVAAIVLGVGAGGALRPRSFGGGVRGRPGHLRPGVGDRPARQRICTAAPGPHRRRDRPVPLRLHQLSGAADRGRAADPQRAVLAHGQPERGDVAAAGAAGRPRCRPACCGSRRAPGR